MRAKWFYSLIDGTHKGIFFFSITRQAGKPPTAFMIRILCVNVCDLKLFLGVLP